MKNLIAFSLVFLTACGPLPQRVAPIPLDMQPYLTQFQQTYSVDPTVVAYEFGYLTDGNAGVCVGRYKIRIDSYAWARLMPEMRRLLLWHEIAHCVIGVSNHDDRKFSDGCPMSIMSSTMTSQYCYFIHSIQMELDYRLKIGR